MLRSIRRWIAAKSASYGLDELARRFARAADEGEGASEGVDISRPYMQCVWVHAAVSLIAKSVSGVPCLVKNASDDVIADGPLVALIGRPNPHQDWSQFVVATFTHLLLDGHVFWERRRMTGNRPGEVYVWPLSKFRPDIRYNEFGDEYVFRWIRIATGEPLIPNDEIFEWKLFNPYNDIFGLAPLSPARLALYCDVATGLYNKNFFKNGARPDVVFTTDDERFTQEQAEAAQARWNAAHQVFIASPPCRRYPFAMNTESSCPDRGRDPSSAGQAGWHGARTCGIESLSR